LIEAFETLQETNIFHLGKRKIIFKNALGWEILIPRRVQIEQQGPQQFLYMGVSKNRGTPKWMVYKGKPY